jgi:peptide/nickel transport system permease protein
MAGQQTEIGVPEVNLVIESAIEPPPNRFRILARSLELWLPVGFLLLMAGACFLWPVIHKMPSPVVASLGEPNLPPLTPHHLFGTDNVGYDVFSRILYGGRVSLEVGFGTAILGLVIGGMIGTLAAYYGGAIEAVIMRILDVLLSFPSLVLAITIATYLGPSELHVIWAISFFAIPAFARLSRARTLQLRESTFVVASKLVGTRDRRMILRHIAPHVVPQLMTFALLGVAIAISIEAALSFLGLGVPPPGPSWGNMIATGQQYLYTDPDLVIIPAAFLAATVASVNLIGDALRARWGVL